MKKMRMIFMSPPGAGKGTHARHISNDYNIPKISVGEIFRNEVKKNTKLGNKLNSYMERGVLVPNEITIETLKKRISEPDCENGFILDGYPRTIEQADALEKITEIELVVNFVLPLEELMTRITNRLTCPKCQRVYNLRNDPPKRDGYCDDCGDEGKLFMREDQKPEIVKQRLETYEKETAPLIGYYKERGILVDFNCNGPVHEVEIKIKKFIKEHIK
ncbi:MAG: adenylate kinase [Nanoarchaeota archaeon]